MKTSEILIAAKAKIATRETWTQGAFATDWFGNAIGPHKPQAKCFCAVGAGRHINPAMYYEEQEWYKLLNGVSRYLYGHTIEVVNDNEIRNIQVDGFDSVHRCYDLAIWRAQQFEQAHEQKILVMSN